jgi:hypothetical protein
MIFAAAALGTTSHAGNAYAGPSEAQYDGKVIICHRADGSGNTNTLRVSEDGAKDHLREHDDDTAGPCPDQ